LEWLHQFFRCLSILALFLETTVADLIEEESPWILLFIFEDFLVLKKSKVSNQAIPPMLLPIKRPDLLLTIMKELAI
jgi:hypothetical protein